MGANKTSTVCQTGGKQLEGRYVNEDFVWTSGDGKIAILMDGATGLGGPKSIDGLTTAEWYVKNVSDYLKTALYDYSKDIKTIVKEAVEKVTALIREYEQDNNMKFEPFEEPSSSLLVYRERRNQEGKNIVEIYEIGDSRAAVQYKDGHSEKLFNPNEESLGKLDGSVLKRMVELAEESGRDVIDTRSDKKIQEMLEVNRAKKNTPEGYYVLGTSTEAVDKGVLHVLDKDTIKQVVLFSDGFNYELLGLSIDEVMERCRTQSGLEELQRQIREAEEADKGGNKQPRFKVSDDMAVIVVGESREQSNDTTISRN